MESENPLYQPSLKALGKISSSESAEVLAKDVMKQPGIMARLPSEALAACEHPHSAPSLLAALYNKGVDHLSFTMTDEARDQIFDEAEVEYRRFSCGMCVMRVWSFRSIDRLVAALEDERESVRGSALYAVGLASVRDPRAVDILAPLLNVGTLAASAAFALGCTGNPRAVGPLIEALEDHDPVVRRFAAHALGEIGDHREVGPLLALLEDDEVNFAAVQALGEMKAAEGASRLATLLRGMSKSHAAANPIHKAPVGESELSPVSPADEKELLKRLTRQTQTARVTRRHILDALQNIGGPAAAAVLNEIAKDSSDPLAETARQMVAQSRETTGNAVSQVRKEAAVQAGAVGKPTADRPSEEIVDPDLPLAGPRIFERLIYSGRLPKDTDEALRYMILADARLDLVALWPRTERLLFADLHSESPQRRLYAARCLIRIGYGEETVTQLIEALTSSDDARMARDFAHCGNERLRRAAITWAEKTGAALKTQPAPAVIWGAMKEP